MMERFNSETNNNESETKSTVGKKLRQYKKIAALITLLSLTQLESAMAQETEPSDNNQEKITALAKKTGEHVKKIADNFKEVGQRGTIGKTKVRRVVNSAKETTTTVGYNNDETETKWLTHEVMGSSLRFFDDNADGSLDKIIINDENSKLGPAGKSLENDLQTFDDMSSLAENAEMIASLKPEKIKVYAFTFENENFLIRSVDFESGEAGELSGPEAEALTKKMQQMYTDEMEELAK